MGKERDLLEETIRLYSPQMPPVLQAIEQDGVCTSRAAFVEKKYQESAKSFLIAYQWFAKKASEIVPKPVGAELPYWAFEDLSCVDASGPDNRILVLDVPKNQVVLFDMYDWTRILRFEYLGETEREEKEFKEYLRQCGLKEYDVMMSQFYPELRQKLYTSWERLFRHHSALLAGDKSSVGSVQAALWKIEKSWISNQ